MYSFRRKGGSLGSLRKKKFYADFPLLIGGRDFRKCLCQKFSISFPCKQVSVNIQHTASCFLLRLGSTGVLRLETRFPDLVCESIGAGYDSRHALPRVRELYNASHNSCAVLVARVNSRTFAFSGSPNCLVIANAGISLQTSNPRIRKSSHCAEVR